MLVEFLQDYRGKLTAEQFYRAGEQAEFPADVAEQLVGDGRAVFADGRPVISELGELEPRELAEGETLEEGEGESLPPITDPAEERQAPARRRSKKAQE